MFYYCTKTRISKNFIILKGAQPKCRIWKRMWYFFSSYTHKNVHSDASWVLQKILLGHTGLLISSSFGFHPVYTMNTEISKEDKEQWKLKPKLYFIKHHFFSTLFIFRSDPEKNEDFTIWKTSPTPFKDNSLGGRDKCQNIFSIHRF